MMEVLRILVNLDDVQLLYWTSLAELSLKDTMQHLPFDCVVRTCLGNICLLHLLRLDLVTKLHLEDHLET